MANKKSRRSHKMGMPPGALVHIGDRKMDQPRISVIHYSTESFSESELNGIDELLPHLKQEGITWVNVDGVHDPEIVSKIGEALEVHSLVLEDVLNTDQRPKFEAHEDFLFFVMKVFPHYQPGNVMVSEQVSMLVRERVVVTFQEKSGDVLDPLRDRIRKGKGLIRKLQTDYLAYAILDIMVDHFFVILEGISEEIESLEEEVLASPGKEVSARIHQLKRLILQVRRSSWPMRELVSAFEKSDSELVRPRTRVFIRDVYDHSIQIIDGIEVLREILTGLLDIYLSGISNRMNQVMKVLTIMASLFIPLTFIVGVYGMNFEYMPELHWKFGYVAVWAVMILAVAGMLWVFKRKKWF